MGKKFRPSFSLKLRFSVYLWIKLHRKYVNWRFDAKQCDAISMTEVCSNARSLFVWWSLETIPLPRKTLLRQRRGLHNTCNTQFVIRASEYVEGACFDFVGLTSFTDPGTKEGFMIMLLGYVRCWWFAAFRMQKQWGWRPDVQCQRPHRPGQDLPPPVRWRRS